MKHRIGLLYLKSVVLLLAAFNFIALLPPATDAASLPLPDKLVYPPLQFDLPHARRTVLANGIVLYLLENHELPLVNINALIKTGTMHDPEGKEGVAELTAYLMKTGGTKKMSSAELDQHFDFLAASPSISTVADFTQISLALLKKDIDQGIDLLAQMMITPAFEQNKFVLAKGLKNEELRRIKDDPQKLAIREFNRLIHHGSPYGRFASQPSLKNIDRGDLVEFHQELFHPQNVMIAISGDITFEDALNTISRCFGSWESRSNSARSVFPPQNSRTGLFYINKEISQSTIITGQPAPGKSSPDFHAFTVLDFIVGSGGFPSRIFSAVRNNEGLAYSAGSFYRARPDQGVFAAYAFTKTESTFQTLSLIDSILESVHAGMIKDDEIAWAKMSINNGFIFSFTSAQQIAWQQMKAEYDMLPTDFFVTYRSKIEKIQKEDLQRTAAKYLDRKNNITLILGDIKNFGSAKSNYGEPVRIAPLD